MQLFPKNPKFFEMFESLAQTIVDASELLKHYQLGKNDPIKLARTVTLKEKLADATCHKLRVEAESTFITPIDREDIQSLAIHLDNIIDYIEDVTSRLAIFNGELKPTPQYREFTNLIYEGTTATRNLVSLLKYRDKYRSKMKQHIIRIHELEHKGDDLMRSSLRTLFTGKSNAVTIIKWKDLYEIMEKVLDECEKTADAVEEITIKNF